MPVHIKMKEKRLSMAVVGGWMEVGGGGWSLLSGKVKVTRIPLILVNMTRHVDTTSSDF